VGEGQNENLAAAFSSSSSKNESVKDEPDCQSEEDAKLRFLLSFVLFAAFVVKPASLFLGFFGAVLPRYALLNKNPTLSASHRPRPPSETRNPHIEKRVECWNGQRTEPP
jgi:hypothetical protein